MIKVNLLPLADRKTQRTFKLPSLSGGSVAVWLIAGVVLCAGMMLAVGTLQSRRIDRLQEDITEAKMEAEQLRPQLERIRKLTKEREEVNRRLSVIAGLDRDRYFRVQLLNDISMQLPRNCWLTMVKEQSPTMLSIEGVTFSNYLVADLMNNLEKTDRFRDVSLTIAQEGNIMDHKVIQFTLQSAVSAR